MVPNGSAYANYPSFANNGTKTPPGGSTESAKYALGMVPADTFPAEWANWLFHGATAGITRLNADVGSIKKEINSLLAAYNITPDASVFNQLYLAIEKRISSLYPVGTIYQNADSNKNPGDSDMLGFGEWVRITDKFLIGAGHTYSTGSEGGSINVTLQTANLPSHKHNITASTESSIGGIVASFPHNHYYDVSHNHEITDPGHGHTIGDGSTQQWSATTQDYGSLGGTYIVVSNGNGFKPIFNYGNTTGITVNSRGLAGNTGDAQNGTLSVGINKDTSAVGSGTAFSIMPPYLAVNMWKRTV